MSKSKAKGTAAETAVVEFLKSMGFPNAERRTLSGANDRGDINLGHNIPPGVVIEVKNCAKMTLSEWVDEANIEAGNDASGIGVVWHKRVRKGSPGEWYVTMDGLTFAAILSFLEE